MSVKTGDVGELGFNLTTPAVPATTVNQKNTFGCTVLIFITTAGTTTAWVITDASGNAVTFTGALALNQLIVLPANASISVTYSVTPAWKWYGMRQSN